MMPTAPNNIQTVARRGYRLIADVGEVSTVNGNNARLRDVSEPGGESAPAPTFSGHGRQGAPTASSVVAIADWKSSEAQKDDDLPAGRADQRVNLELISARAEKRGAKNSWFLGIAALAIVLIGLGYFVYRLTRPVPASGPNPTSQITRLTSNGKVQLAAISPDGRFVAYTTRENDGKQSLWLKNIANESETKIPDAPDNLRSLQFSHDGNSLPIGSRRSPGPPTGHVLRFPSTRS